MTTIAQQLDNVLALESLEAEIREQSKCMNVLLGSELSDWADRLSAIRAALSKAESEPDEILEAIDALKATTPPPASQERGGQAAIAALREIADAARDVMATELGEIACFGSDAPCEYALGLLKNKLFNYKEIVAAASPPSSAAEECAPFNQGDEVVLNINHTSTTT